MDWAPSSGIANYTTRGKHRVNGTQANKFIHTTAQSHLIPRTPKPQPNLSDTAAASGFKTGAGQNNQSRELLSGSLSVHANATGKKGR